MPISKLATAFERQFFSSIQEINTKDDKKLNIKSDKLDQLDKDGNPKHIFDDISLYRQYHEYNELKILMYSRLAQINCFSGLFIGIGAVYLIFLTISLFISNTLRDPIAVILGQAVVF